MSAESDVFGSLEKDVCVSHSLVSDSLQHHGLQPARLLCPRNSPGRNTTVPFPSLGDLPDPGIEPRSPTLQADALPSEPPGKPKMIIRNYVNDCFCNVPKHHGHWWALIICVTSEDIIYFFLGINTFFLFIFLYGNSIVDFFPFFLLFYFFKF